MARDDNIDLGAIRAQGREARKLTDDQDAPHVFTPQDCPYGPGELADAWLGGFGAAKEEVRQADTSRPTTQDVRTDAPAETVRKGAKGSRGGKGRGAKGRAQRAAKQPVAATTGTTGNAETSLPTKRAAADPGQTAAPSIETTLGDPRATTGDRTQLGGADDGDAAAADKNKLM